MKKIILFLVFFQFKPLAFGIDFFHSLFPETSTNNILNEYKYPISEHFDGNHFFYPNEESYSSSLMGVIKRRLFYKRTPWEKYIPVTFKKIKNKRVKELYVTFIGHLTTLIQIENVNILTDPVWSKEIGPEYLKLLLPLPTRTRMPGVLFDDLPPIDVVVISHNHYDHMDLPTIKMLKQKFDPIFLVGLGNQRYIDHITQNVIELDWRDSFKYQNLNISFVKNKHWSRRGLFDTNKALWGSFVISGERKKIYFAGDTAWGDHFYETYEVFKSFDLAILPIGSYKPTIHLKNSHMNPEEAVLAMKTLNAKKSLAVSFGTFNIASNEGIDEPVIDLKKSLDKHHLNEDEFVVLEHGQGLAF